VVARLDKTSAAGGELKPGAWNHVAVTLAERLVVYVDGTEVAAQPAQLRELSGEMVIGQGYAGEMDVLGVAATPRSAAMVRLMAAQGMEGRLLAYGEPEEASAQAGGDHSYMGVLIDALTIDAKVVIVILLVMFAIACWVVVDKAVLVARADRQNARFIDEFESKPREYLDPTTKASQHLSNGALKHSSLARLYATGMRELSQRTAAGQTGSLSAEALAAIKAAIDSTLIRENQKLNRLMVLLTIAISGGPFLGLLGTVVGVMITFAAIAASGDININSIAPGIAAALLATVAGLAVAIPALFGYNYLLIRIKNITADMQAFSDEFVARMAEARAR
jgi:biopolymer transport protein ExbB